MSRLFHHCSFLILSLSIAVPVFPAIPAPGARVSDYAGILSQADREKLQGVIGRVEASTTAEIFVVTVSSLDGLAVEEYANQLFNRWGIGKKGKDNGLLVLVAPKDRKMWIEVGYGMEAVVPDGLAGAVIREAFIPHFKKDDYAGGILEGVDRLAAIVEGRESAAIQPDSEYPTLVLPRTLGALAVVGFISIFVVLGMGAVGHGFGSKTVFFIIWGGMFAGIPSIMLLASPELGFFRIIPYLLGLPAAILGFRRGKKAPPSKPGKIGKGGGSGGWTWGASGSSSGRSGGGWSSGGSSSGGGGGRSGGGGAGGSW
jgi:uncharacterized protein